MVQLGGKLLDIVRYRRCVGIVHLDVRILGFKAVDNRSACGFVIPGQDTQRTGQVAAFPRSAYADPERQQ